MRSKISQKSNDRYAESLVSLNEAETLESKINFALKPVMDKKRKYRAVDPLGKDKYLIRALCDGKWSISGIRNKDLQSILKNTNGFKGKSKKQLSGKCSRLIRMLRAHGILKKSPHTNRYTLTEKGCSFVNSIRAAMSANTRDLEKIAV